jgi:hypothetical protein
MPSWAQDESDIAIKRLKQTPTFALGQVGFIGHISEGERRYRAILRSKEALKIFTGMLAAPDASTEARLYAACGIRRLSPVSFRNLTRELRTSGATASVLRADILRLEPVTALLGRIEKFGCEPMAAVPEFE